MDNGKELFLRYSHGCRMYCEGKGMISAADMTALDSGDPSPEVLRRVFYVAIPSLESIAKRMGKDVFDINVLRDFYSGEHNERKMKEGQLICLSFPARVTASKGDRYLIELEPVRGSFWSASQLKLKAGDWVAMHRADIVEKIPEEFALGMAEKLRKLGLDKTYKFPKVAIKYLNELKNANNKNKGIDKETANNNTPGRQGRKHGNEQANKISSDESTDECS